MYGDVYATLAQLKSALRFPGVSNTTFDPALNLALDAASREVESYCGRTFSNDIDASNVRSDAVARVYTPSAMRLLHIDDLYTTDDLEIRWRSADSNAWSDPWPNDGSVYDLEPLNAVVAGQVWPYNRILLRPYKVWFRPGWRVQIAGHYGWASVPSPIVQATLIHAAKFYKRAEAPMGVAGTSEGGQGLPQVKIYESASCCSLLDPYVSRYPLVG